MADVPRIGTQFAGYRIDALIGRGGMSVVYRAENPRLGNMVALKLLAPELAADETFRERFVRESRLAASINHPNIIPIYDAGAHEDLLYIAMRYVDGLDLKQLIRQRGPLPPAQALSIIGQAARALDAAHRRGLVHRDVKPANILVESADAGNEHAYLADFGLMKHPSSRSGLTATGQFMGTIDYVSPEQIEGKPVDARSDLYSLGCVLYEALAGRVPYVKDADVAVMFAHLNEAPPKLSELRRDLPAAIDAVIDRSLAKSPDDRYASCQEMVEAARAALSGEARPAPPETLVAPTVAADATRASSEPPRDDQRTVGMPAGAPTVPLSMHRTGASGGGKRSRLVLVVALIALIAIGAGVAVGVTRGGSSKATASGSSGDQGMGSGSSGMGSGDSGTTGTTGGEQLSQIEQVVEPAINLDLCDAPETSGDLTTMVCTNSSDTGQFTHVVFSMFPDTATLYRQYQTDFKTAQAADPDLAGYDSGRCRANIASNEDAWRHKEQLANIPLNDVMDADGRIFCWIANSVPFIEWTSNSVNLLGQATGHVHPDLFAWWRDHHHLVMGQMPGM